MVKIMFTDLGMDCQLWIVIYSHKYDFFKYLML